MPIPAILALEDGRCFEGTAFGATGTTTGEICFNTSMTGYQEVITDPSYRGQIVAMTYPQIGNSGINAEDWESRGTHLNALVIGELCTVPSNWRSTQPLGDYLAEQGILGIEDIDTRALTKHLRSLGVMRACVAYDFGLKFNILRRLRQAGFDVEVVTSTTTAEEVLAKKPDGVFLSNGPGDPSALGYIHKELRQLIGQTPIFGICLGNQLLAHAFGGTTFKLKFGHRGGNQPVKDLRTGKISITSQNHGFAVDPDSLPPEIEVTHINLNDGTVEGMRHRDLPVFSVQYHPESAPGPNDANYFFDEFAALIDRSK